MADMTVVLLDPVVTPAGTDLFAVRQSGDTRDKKITLTQIGAGLAGVFEPADATILKDAAIGVSVQAYDATIVVDADIGVSVQAYDATIVVDADIGVSVQAYDADTVKSDDAAYNATEWDLAYGWGDHASGGYAASGHNHSGVYEPVDATILKNADIGVSVQAYDATIVVDGDIGTSVQAYDADTAKTDVQEVITVDWTISHASKAQLWFIETGATANEGKWSIHAESDGFYIQAFNDALGSTDNVIHAIRTNENVTQVEFGGIVKVPGGGDSDDWDAAFGWGDHASGGYVSQTGSNANNQIAHFTESGVITSNTGLTWDGSTLETVGITTILGGDIKAGPAGAVMKDLTPSRTSPSLCPYQGDLDTGFGWEFADTMSIIIGGVVAVEFLENAGEVTMAFGNSVGQTAHTGSSQGDGPITKQYNEYSTVANAGDAATLPLNFKVGTTITCINNGANSMDIFPYANDYIDSLGQNVAYALAAGASITFFATAQHNNWVTLVPPAGAGAWDSTGYPMLENLEIADQDADGDTVGFKCWWAPDNTPGNEDGPLLAMNWDYAYKTQIYLDADLTSADKYGLWFRCNYDSSWTTWYRALSEVDGFEHTAFTHNVTAHTGSSQLDGPLLTTHTLISTCANAGDAVTLPNLGNPDRGKLAYIRNAGAEACDVFPYTGDKIDGGSVNAAVSLPAGQWIEYLAVSDGEWMKIRGGTN